VEDHRGDTFRAVYTVWIGDAVHVLHAFQKKSKSGYRHSAARRGVDREAVEGSARPIWCEREIVMTRKDHPQGTGSVLADLGFADAEDLSAKAVLAVKLNELIDKRSLSQIEAAHITGMTQPKVSQVRRYKLQNISLERLMQALVSLDQHIEIVVRPARRANTAGITVAT
jgi:predicted XRE-type DNA-binding protein